jgi:hypothetical protein
MHFHRGIADAIGHTPLIRLEHASETTGCSERDFNATLEHPVEAT